MSSGLTDFNSFDSDEDDSPGWIVTFADSMSLLLSFFVLLISFSSFDNDYVDKAVSSVNQHLGGGEKIGSNVVKADFAKAEVQIVMDETLTSRLIEQASDNKAERVIDLEIKKFNKMTMLKDMLKENPSVLKLLLEKKLKEAGEEKKAEAPAIEEKRFDVAQAELVLQNLEQFVMQEGIDDLLSIDKKDNGDVGLDFDCIALFDPDTDNLNVSSEMLLLRIGHILSMLPNHIAIVTYNSQAFSSEKLYTKEIDLAIARAHRLISYFEKCKYAIEQKRFSVMQKAYGDVVWKDIKSLDISGEGVIGINILAYDE